MIWWGLLSALIAWILVLVMGAGITVYDHDRCDHRTDLINSMLRGCRHRDNVGL